MNFRFKRGKVIVSIIISLLLSFFIIGRNYVCWGPGPCWGGYLWMLGGFIVFFIIISFIWSMVAKKKK